MPPTPAYTATDEARDLKYQADVLEQQLRDIRERLTELENAD